MKILKLLIKVRDKIYHKKIYNLLRRQDVIEIISWLNWLTISNIFILLNKKVVLVETSLNKNVVYPEDILALKKAAEKYQIALQILNN